MSCNVYKIRYAVDSSDRHFALFIETAPPYGTIMHVQGNLETGMTYSARSDIAPTLQPSFESRQFVGLVRPQNAAALVQISSFVTPPWSQFDEQGLRILEHTPLFGPEEWVDEVVKRLRDVGIFENGG